MSNLNQTKNCIRCFKPAKIWSGHILRNGRQIVAGWCSERCQDAKGFCGQYVSDMDKDFDD